MITTLQETLGEWRGRYTLLILRLRQLGLITDDDIEKESKIELNVQALDDHDDELPHVPFNHVLEDPHSVTQLIVRKYRQILYQGV